MLQSLIDLARMPVTDVGNWLEDAEQSVRFLTQSCKTNEEIVLYASGPHLFAHAVLVPRAAVDPPDHDDIVRAQIMPDETWCIQRSYGGGQGHRVYLEPPLSYPGCSTLVGGEKLIFLRSFEDVKAYRPVIEISQKLVHALGLYYMDERRAYCRLDNRGNFEDVITVFDDEHTDPWQRMRAIIIRGHDLATYMALSNTALVMKFDVTRYDPDTFSSWDGQDERIYQDENIYYRYCVMPNHASYANGHIVMHTKLTENELIKEWEAEEDTSTKQYASFKIFDGKNNSLVETSCGPDHIVTCFTESDLPWGISPAFFRPEVLHKYKLDPEKYTINDRSISCRGSWHLKTYDINEAGQVHTYICYLATLPYEEQLYWKSFNEWPKSNISRRAHQTDILGKFSTEDDPLAELKAQIQSLDRDPPDWWRPRGEALVEEVLGPATDTIEEWGNEILALDHLVVEGFDIKGLRSIINAKGGTVEKEWRSLKLLEVVLSLTGHTEEQAKELVAPLKKLHNLRNPVKAHGDPKGRQAAVASARKAHGTLRKHFQDIVRRVRDSIKQILSTLSTA